MIDGILNVYKEQGYTSFDVVAKLRGILKQKKIGHTGTLDPLAEGVLVVCLGKATKLVDMLIEGDKIYKCSMIIGFDTDTEDVTGNIINKKTARPDDATIKEVINSFIGKYNQIPPMYSAIKVNGKKLYEYARNGETIKREPRAVEIFDIYDISIDECLSDELLLSESFSAYKENKFTRINMTIHCSKGTYIRSLCRDIGYKLGCFGTLSYLQRLEAHGNYASDALRLCEIEEFAKNNNLDSIVKPLDVILKNYEATTIKEKYKTYLDNGNKLKKEYLENIPDTDDLVRVYYKDKMMALYYYDADEDIFRPKKILF